MKHFWREIGAQYLYCFIPMLIMMLQLFLYLLCMIYRSLNLMLCLSTIIFVGQLILYFKLVYGKWKKLKRSGGMACFEKGQQFSNVLMWWISMGMSFIFVFLAFGMILGY